MLTIIFSVNQEKYRESKVKMVDLPTFIKEDVQQTVFFKVILFSWLWNNID